MKKLLFLTVAVLVLVTFSSCRREEPVKESTSTESTSAKVTAEPAARTDLSVDEIVALYNNTIINAEKVTRLYTRASYKNLYLSSDVFEPAVKNVLEKTVKDDNETYTSTQKSEIEQILPKPCLDKSMIKSYTVNNSKITLTLYDVENPTDEGCIKLYPLSFLTDKLEENNISASNIKMEYSDCKIVFTVDRSKKGMIDLSYSWNVHASGNFELLFKTHSLEIDISVGESYAF